MFSTNIKQKGRERRRQTGAILLGSAFGFLALLWSGLIVYIGLTARAELAPIDVLTCQAALTGEPTVSAARDQDQGKQVPCDRKLGRKRHPSYRAIGLVDRRCREIVFSSVRERLSAARINL